ncbi:apoptosis-antagonizing transcription factor [Obelidium mucronatum]|nr:apoptosis-antagonizing transcription factor [Obelidium mucronatum]
MSFRAPRTKKGLGELLAELSNPKPDSFDPENEGGDGLKQSAESDSDNDFGYENEDAKRDHYVSVGRGKIRSQLGVSFNDEMEAKYKGSKVSRREVVAQMSEDEEDDDNDEEEEDEEDDGDDDEEEDEDENSNGDDDDDDSSSEEEEDDEEADQEKVAADLKLLAAREKDLLKNLASSSNGDVEKGRNVKAQMAIWESLLDVRINLQPALTSANTLPLPSEFEYFRNPNIVSKTSLTNTSNAISDATTLVTSLIHDLISFRASLASQNDTVVLTPRNFATNVLKKRKRSETEDDEDDEDNNNTSNDDDDDSGDSPDSLWSQITAFDSAFDPFRDATIDKWSNKVMASAVANVNQGKKFKAINQSALVQIRAILSDKERLVKRTRLVRSGGRDGSGRHLGHLAATTTTDAAATAKKDADGESKRVKTELEEVEELHEKELNRKNKSASDSHLSNFDEQVFDDGDFYQQLLKELIEGRLLETDDPTLLSMKWAELKTLQSQTKKKKTVDTKASKGRKIRYAVHEKLANFMAPEPRGTWHDAMVGELFFSLFGNSNNNAKSAAVVGDDEPHQSGENASSWEEVQIPADGLKLFG